MTVAVATVAAAWALTACGGASPDGHSTGGGRVVTAPRSAVALHIGAAGRPLPRGFLGLSIEFQAIRAYTGTDPSAIDPVFEALVRGLTPGQRPVLRIGGDSTDISWVPAAGVARPRFTGYRLTPGWLSSTAALAHALDARMILGVNLAADEPALDGAEVRAYVRAFGRSSIDALEIGNEPNLYATIPQFTLRTGEKVTPRPRRFGPPAYRRELAAVRAALPRTDPAWSLAAPALAAGQDFDSTGRWTRGVRSLLGSDPALSQITVHRYPQKNCYTTPSSPMYPTIAHLLSSYSTTGLAGGVRGWVALARAQGRTVRIDELNSAACEGRPGVSDTFASALWAPDALFSLASAGVAGVNVHTLPGASYGLFSFRRAAGHWQAHVAPEYYGLKLFAQAAPAGARLMDVTGVGHTTSLSAWATRAGDGTVRLLLIDKDPTRARDVRVPVAAGDRGAVTIERMRAPRVAARGGVTLGGRSYGTSTSTGTLRAPETTPAPRTAGGDAVIRVPGASAALVTFAAKSS